MKMLYKKMIRILFLYKNKMNVIDLSWRNLRPTPILSLLKDIKDKKEISSIDLQGNFLYRNGLSELFLYIVKEFKNISHLNLSFTNLTIHTFSILSPFLKELTYLKSLSLSHNIIIKHSISYLEPILPQLEELNLSYNFLKTRGVNLLTSFFPKMKQLKRFYLKNCCLYNSNIYLIAENISYLKHLEYFSLEGNYCNSSVLSYLLLELPKENLKYLNLGNLCIFFNDISLFMHQLQYTSFLSSQLELCSNLEVLIWNMYYDFHLLKGIEKCQNLKKLVLSINPLFDEINISYFPFLPNLEYLKVSSIYKDTFESILKKIPNTIKTLSFQYITGLNYNSYQLLEIRLKELSLLHSFEINYSSLNSFILKNLCTSFIYCYHLKNLSLSNNFIDDRGMYYLSFLFRYLKELHTINISNNLLTNIGIKIIIQSLCYYKKKIHCILDNNFTYNNDTFFQEFISLFKIYKEKLLYSNQWTRKEKEMYFLIKSFHPFSHIISSIILKDKEEYNKILLELKKDMNEKKNYFLFNSFIEKTNDYHSFFYEKDIQYLIQQYL